MVQNRDVGNCFLCVPLRTAVKWFCALTTMWSIFCIIVLFLDDVRYQFAGYNPVTRKLLVYGGALGLFFGMLGNLGIYDEKVNLVRYFNAYQWGMLGLY